MHSPIKDKLFRLNHIELLEGAFTYVCFRRRNFLGVSDSPNITQTVFQRGIGSKDALGNTP